MEQVKGIQFGKDEYEQFQFIFDGMYKEIREGKDLLQKLNEVEEGIRNLNTYIDREDGLTNFWLEDVRGDLLYLKQLIFEQMETIAS
ncbi:hypothetical protein SAMN05444008_102422 [Cnuella takakiae]|uniref:Uncharacterized protein n=1 Tax=Cnuella takakiae TaxID=1302690 RepID=A0A1M4VYE1_9BACT|nr:hypothetical protein [Cnuella takakiae]OLY92465.1 hypothetical protein BUE76_11640 [Cnuella takakiae]SHE73883.1 hypothetical protein SAMN05444008_102422 [Cnuella takakiae]